MTAVQDATSKIRKQKFIYNYPNSSDSSCSLLNIRSINELSVYPDVSYIRLSTAISTLFGSFLIVFLISNSSYLLINQLSFLLVDASYCVVEFTKYITNCFRTGQNFSLITLKNCCIFSVSYVVLVTCSYIICILFGADLTENILGTFIFSCHLSIFTLVPFYFHASKNFFRLIIAEERPKSSIECCDLIIVCGIVVGAWFGAFVIPLDWDLDWQMWPIPCVLGTIFGFTASNIFLLLCSFLNGVYLQQMFNILKIKQNYT